MQRATSTVVSLSFAQRQLAGEAGLADPRLADDGDDAAAAGVAHGGERPVQAVELLVAADERRIEAPLGANECVRCARRA